MKLTWLIVPCLLLIAACSPRTGDVESTKQRTSEDQKTMAGKTSLATFGGGCFWCVEAVFERLEGVHQVKSGYAGGHQENPTYKQISKMTTGHAEVCQISYDPSKIDFETLLEVFWKTHDPTTKNRQGNDAGPQYRSIILYHDDQQKQLALRYKKKLDASGAFNAPIVTEILPLTRFWVAEQYHQDYYELNKDKNPYCQAVIVPKIKKLEQVFKDKLKQR